MRRWARCALLLLVGCKGELVAPTKHEGPDAAEARLRRLTPQQYANTARDLLSASSVTVDIPVESSEIVSLLAAEKLSDAADLLVALGKHQAQVPCDVDGGGSDDCASAYIDSFGAKAFRRPLLPEEKEWLFGVYTKARVDSAFTFAESIDVITRVILQAPQLYYLHEQGVDDAALPFGLRRLNGYERAARLSYFLWSSTPDPALLDAAKSGALDTDAGVRTQAERMLADPRAKDLFRQFVTNWLELDGTPTHNSLEKVSRDRTKYPLDSAGLRAGMRAEVSALVDRVVQNGGSFKELLTSRDAYVNGPLAKLYGIANPPADANTYKWVTLDGTQRSGLFTRGAFLLLQSNPQVESPIRRGAFLVKRVFCRELGVPPPNASDTPINNGSTSEGGTVVRRSLRDAVMAQTSGGVCSSCHSQINPAGFGLGNFNAVGGWQTEEKGKDPDGTAYTLPIDVSGEFVQTDVAGPFTGAVSLSEHLATSREVRACVVKKWFQAAFQRPPETRERGSVKRVEDAFAQNDSLKELLLTLVTTPAFLDVRVTQ